MIKKNIYLLSVLAIFFVSCIDIKLEDQFSDPDAITNTDTARELLASAYNSLPRYQLEFSVLSDDFVPNTLASKDATMLNLYKWQEKAIDDLSYGVWGDYYMTVAVLNALLPRLELITPEDDADALELSRIKSEALALKAMCYLDLLRLYAPVWSEQNLDKDGIILKNRLELDFLPRSSVRDCAVEVEKLLNEALNVDNSSAPVFYFSTDAVKALKVEFLVWKGDWAGVVEVGEPLLADSKSKWTKTAYGNLWSSNDSPDRIFAPYIFDSFYTTLCYDKTQGDYFILSPKLNWSEDDYRKDWSVYVEDMPAGKVNGLGKYNRMYYENATVRYINTLRYSGVCFAVAEAYARIGNDKMGRKWVNELLSAYSSSVVEESVVGQALIDRVLLEKQKEFVGEGVRLFDLKRICKPLVRMKTMGTAEDATIKSDDYRWLFPIPRSEYKYNDKVHQNPEWPYIRTE